MNRTKKTSAVLAIATALTLGLAGCNSTSKHTDPYDDAPRAKQDIKNQWYVIRSLDGYKSGATQCLVLPGGVKTGLRLISTFQTDGKTGFLTAVPDAKNC